MPLVSLGEDLALTSVLVSTIYVYSEEMCV